jgi:hypothetical protein
VVGALGVGLVGGIGCVLLELAVLFFVLEEAWLIFMMETWYIPVGVAALLSIVGLVKPDLASNTAVRLWTVFLRWIDPT